MERTGTVADYQNHGEMFRNVPLGTTPTHVDSKLFSSPDDSGHHSVWRNPKKRALSTLALSSNILHPALAEGEGTWVK